MEYRRKDMILMDKFTKMNKLDLKQAMAFKVVCATFTLYYIEKYVYNGLRSDSRYSGTRGALLNVLNNTAKSTL